MAALPLVTQATTAKRRLSANGRANPSSRTSSPKRPKNAFDVYCSDLRSVITVKNRKAIADGSFDVERALAVGWQDMDEEQRGDFQRRFEEMKKASELEKGGEASRGAAGYAGESKHAAEADEDVEMGEDGDDGSPPGGDAGGFTAVNRE